MKGPSLGGEGSFLSRFFAAPCKGMFLNKHLLRAYAAFVVKGRAR